MTNIRNLDQDRAKHAWGAVGSAKSSLNKDAKAKYAGEAKKLPIRIMNSGLGQALVFLASKTDGGKKHEELKRLSKDISSWVLVQIGRKSESEDLLKVLIQGDTTTLRRATDETLAYLQWLNRFAEAEGLDEGKK